MLFESFRTAFDQWNGQKKTQSGISSKPVPILRSDNLALDDEYPFTTNAYVLGPNRFVRIKEGRMQSNNVPGTVLDCRINANHIDREVN